MWFLALVMLGWRKSDVLKRLSILSVAVSLSVLTGAARADAQPQTPEQGSIAPVGVKRGDYQNEKSRVMKYDAPDPNVKPLELRMQDTERRLSELESEMEATRSHLRDVIVAVNRLTLDMEGSRR